MAVISDAELGQLKRFMDESSYTCTREWLVACVEWIKENFSTLNFAIFKKELLEQWKDTNLEEMESSCLPPNLQSQRLVKLGGKYGLQVNSMRDIGESAYSQWIKVKKLENENVSVAATDSTEYKQSWQPTAKRCLYLTMTDGSQCVFGLEMQPIPGLSVTMKPGFKLIITGPVDCRRGVIHLKPSNVRIIGGEIEEFLDSNRMEMVLASALQISADNVPHSSTQLKGAVPSSGISNVSSSARPKAITDNRGNEVMGDFPDSEDQFPDVANSSLFGDDDIFMGIDEEALISSASVANTSNSSTSTIKISQMTTQILPTPNTNSSSFTEEIEDYENDYSFTSSSRPSAAKPSSRINSTGSNFAVPTNMPIPNVKPKTAFVPPSVIKDSKSDPVPKMGTGPSNSAKSNQDSLKVRSAPSTTILQNQIKSEKGIIGSTFKSAKSASGSSGSGKQQNILQYMKPMPVIIDPPTPERQVKRQRKRIEEGVLRTTHEKSTESESKHIPADEPETIEDDDLQASPDDSLMRIIDQTVENKLLECGEENKAASPSRASFGVISAKSYPVTVSENPYIFLMQVNQMLENLAKIRKVVKVKACVSTVVSNIKMENGQWTLGVCINDGTGYLNCKISADILNRIIGFTPAEMKKIKASKTKESKQLLSAGMIGLAKTLVHLNAIFSIEIGEDPIIIEMTDLMLHHSQGIQDRLRQL